MKENKKKICIFSIIILSILILSGILFWFLNKDISDNYIRNNTVVIVRSTGERTEKKCIENLEKIFKKENIYLIKNVTPLAKVTEQTYALGLAKKKKWILSVDSDVFLFKDKIFLLIKKANRLIKKNNKAFCFYGLVFDKISQTERMAGTYLIYSENLKYKKEYYEQCLYAMRSETCIRDKIENTGYFKYKIKIVVGIHDFFQYNKDIVKKCILHTKKHYWKIDKWHKMWKEKSKEDSDFIWALKGYEIYNSLKDKNIYPDANLMNELIKGYNIPEKSDEITDEEIQEAINEYNTQKIDKLENIEFVRKERPKIKTY